MGIEFATGLSDGTERRARKFDLPAGFQRDRGAFFLKCDQVVTFKNSVPSVTRRDFFQQTGDAPIAVIGDAF